MLLSLHIIWTNSFSKESIIRQLSYALAKFLSFVVLLDTIRMQPKDFSRQELQIVDLVHHHNVDQKVLTCTGTKSIHADV